MDYENPEAIWANVPVCAAHPMGWQFQPGEQDDCEGCQNELAARGAVIDQMQAEGQSRSKGLAQSGVQIPMDMMNAIKMDLIVDTMFGGDMRNRFLFEGEFGRRVLNTLKQLQSDMAQQRITKPNGAGKLIIPRQKP